MYRTNGQLFLAHVVSRLELDWLRAGIEADAGRILARFEKIELLAQHSPHHQHAAVALAEMLFRVQRDRTLANLRFVIAGISSVLLLGHVPPELAVEFRAHAADVTGLFDAAGDIDAEGRIVDRQHPADRFHPRELCNARVRHDAQRWEHR